MNSPNRPWLQTLFAGVFLVLTTVIFATANSSQSQAAKFSAIAVDARTGKIIFAKNIDSRRYPASLTKIMTLYLVFEDLRAGKINMNTRLRISNYAARRPPSKLGFKPGQTIAVRDAIRALVTKSANDVATAVAENLGGTEAAFARRMTRTARRLGMTRTNFANASGLPNTRQTTTARDMATLGLRIQRDFPRYYRYFGTRRFTYRGRRYGNHNRLLGRVEGVDGIKTGYTRASGFNLTSSVRRGKKRIVAVVMGGRTGRSRNRYMSGLIYKMFKTRRLTNGTRIANMAGRPPGYTPKKRTRIAAKPKAVKKAVIIPRSKPKKASKPAVVAKRKTLPKVPKHAARTTFKTAVIVDDEPAELVKATPQAVDPTPTATVNRNTKQQNLLPIPQLPGAPAPTLKQVQTKAPEKAAPKPKQKVVAKAPKPKTNPAYLRSWNIQIGAFPSDKSARGRLADATNVARWYLKGKKPFTVEVKRNGGSFYRARFAGFNKRTAKRACRKLTSKGIGCFPVAPQI